MYTSTRKGILIGTMLGVATTGFVDTLMAQQAAQPGRLRRLARRSSPRGGSAPGQKNRSGT